MPHQGVLDTHSKRGRPSAVHTVAEEHRRVRTAAAARMQVGEGRHRIQGLAVRPGTSDTSDSLYCLASGSQVGELPWLPHVELCVSQGSRGSLRWVKTRTTLTLEAVWRVLFSLNAAEATARHSGGICSVKHRKLVHRCQEGIQWHSNGSLQHSQVPLAVGASASTDADAMAQKVMQKVKDLPHLPMDTPDVTRNTVDRHQIIRAGVDQTCQSLAGPS